MNNECHTWSQGRFIDSNHYKYWSKEQKEKANNDEKKLVRPAPKESAICMCNTPNEAAWIAQRLNLASRLEQLAYDFAVGKTDSKDIRNFVKRYFQLLERGI